MLLVDCFAGTVLESMSRVLDGSCESGKLKSTTPSRSAAVTALSRSPSGDRRSTSLLTASLRRTACDAVLSALNDLITCVSSASSHAFSCAPASPNAFSMSFGNTVRKKSAESLGIPDCDLAAALLRYCSMASVAAYIACASPRDDPTDAR